MLSRLGHDSVGRLEILSIKRSATAGKKFFLPGTMLLSFSWRWNTSSAKVLDWAVVLYSGIAIGPVTVRSDATAVGSSEITPSTLVPGSLRKSCSPARALVGKSELKLESPNTQPCCVNCSELFGGATYFLLPGSGKG